MMPTSRIDRLLPALADGHDAVRIVLVRAEGSTPREMGADMMIYDDHFDGTIGGGTLEHEAIHEARKMLAETRIHYRMRRQYPLGPTLGQCCGGFVEVLFEHIKAEDFELWQDIIKSGSVFHPDDPALPPSGHAEGQGTALTLLRQRTPLYLYGAGHVGRALIEVTSGLPLDRFWIDTEQDRFPDDVPQNVEKIIAANPAQIPDYAPKDAIHLVMSYSHQIDLELCLAILKRNQFKRLGLIGSQTKKARFLKSLGQGGIDESRLEKLVCPIGLAEIGGKEPFRVALSIAGQLSEWTRQEHLE